MYTVYFEGSKRASFNKLGDAIGFVANEEGRWPLWKEVLDETCEHRRGWRWERWFIRG